MGDGVMATFDAASDAVAGRRRHAAGGRRGRAEARPAGRHRGRRRELGGRRLLRAARSSPRPGSRPEPTGGQILVSQVVRWLAGDRAGATLPPLGPFELQGLPEPVEVFEVGWEPLASSRQARVAGAPPRPAGRRSPLPVRRPRRRVGRPRGGLDERARRRPAHRAGRRRGGRRQDPAGGRVRPDLPRRRRRRAVRRLRRRAGAALPAVGPGPRPPDPRAAGRGLDGRPMPSTSADLVVLLPQVERLAPRAPAPARVRSRGRPVPPVRRGRRPARRGRPAAPRSCSCSTTSTGPAARRSRCCATSRTGATPSGSSSSARSATPATRSPSRWPAAWPTSGASTASRGSGSAGSTRRASSVSWLGDRPGPRRRAATAGHDPGRRTGGNAFFVGELWDHLVSTGAVQRADGRWSVQAELPATAVPESIREVVADRVAKLPPAARAMLELVAAAGQRVELRGAAARRRSRHRGRAVAGRARRAGRGRRPRERRRHRSRLPVRARAWCATRSRPASRRWPGPACTSASPKRSRRCTRPTGARCWPSWPGTSPPARRSAGPDKAVYYCRRGRSPGHALGGLRRRRSPTSRRHSRS